MGFGSRRRRLAVIGVEQDLPPQQDAGDPEQPVGDSAQGATVGVASRSQGLVVNRRWKGAPDRRAKGTPCWCAAQLRWGGSGAVLEPPAVVAGFDDVAVVGQAV